MPLTAGSRLGPYEILTPIGAGGMGEVYKARDTRLERTVAIKVLPEHLSQNVDLRQRFEREAKAISALSHPHICGLFDVGEQEGTAYLVMEFLEGETVADRLGRGRIPTEQLLRFSIEIASALDKAHRQGIVHRDLKPGNIMLTKSGVKLLDFGLAKLRLAGDRELSTALSTLATEASAGQPLTERGTILGTFQYMAPEQLEGKEADSRSDIFSFGAVLYEMATGQKAFAGKSQASLIASILEHEPPAISSVQPMVPPALDRVVKICLAKEPDDRWQTAHDLESELKWIAQVGSQAGVAAPVAARRKNRERLAWTAFAVAALASALLAFGYLRRAPKPAASIRASIPLPEKMFIGEIALSPDGTRLAYGLSKAGGQPQLWIRSLDAPAGHPVADGENAFFPFWSPDGRFVAFFTGDGKLKRVDASGGSLLVICDAERGVGGTWNRDGTIVFAPTPTSALFRVPAGGGQPVAVTKLDASRHETAHRYPHFLPDGRHFLYMAANLSAPPNNPANAVRVGSLDGKEDRPLVSVASNAAFASGHLLYAREGALLAQRLDKRLEPVGEPIPIAQSIRFTSWVNFTNFSVSENGLFLYAPAFAPTSQLLWLDRGGKQIGSVGEPAVFLNQRLSPDGRRLAIDVFDPAKNASDLWLYGADGSGAAKFVFGPGSHGNPVWSPDGKRVAFSSDRKAKGVRPDIWVKPVDGGMEELLLENSDSNSPEDWSRDGRFLSISTIPAQGTRIFHVWVLDLGSKRKVIEATEGGNNGAADSRFSPDGRWLAYDSDESGRSEVYVQAFPGPGGKWQVSAAGGVIPRWRGDGKELFYLSLDNKIMAVPLETTPAFHAGAPAPLFAVHPGGGTVYDVAADGKRFLVNSLPADQGSPPLSLLVNWTSLIKP
ncbi:MAG TPA: protein kinase [Thermoanaerobaculia bacterium]|nr:protein kinase [Thermoanaerobaculia bacterium]